MRTMGHDTHRHRGGFLRYALFFLLSPALLLMSVLWLLALLFNLWRMPFGPERTHHVKRTFDVLAAGIGVLLLAPLLLLVSLLVLLGSPGGVFFRQARVGLRGREFLLLKFRSMRPGSESAGQITVGRRDPRITGVGHILRRTKLDELPQLWNVLRGDMSFVGPRPCLPSQVELVAARRALGLHAIRPGITGVAQVAGLDMSDPQRLAAADAEYLKTMSLGTDLRQKRFSFLNSANRTNRCDKSRPRDFRLDPVDFRRNSIGFAHRLSLPACCNMAACEAMNWRKICG